MKQITITKIQNTTDVKTFFGQLTDTFGLNWHLEDDFNSYQVSKSDAEKLNVLMEKSYDVCNDENLICSFAFESTKNLRQELCLGV
jgi:hypothetical protein